MTFEAAQPRASSDTVDVTLTGGGIVTSGDCAVGIIAQSIGGGGGFAVDTEQALNVYEGDGSSYTYVGGSSGSIGDVTVSLDAKSSIATTGDYAHGIIAQSLGGGGGLFQKDGKTYAGSLGRDGSDTASGKVTVDISGTVATKADNAFAIFAQNQTGALSITVEEGGSVTGSGAAADNGTYAGGAVWATSSASNADNVTLTVSGTLTGNAMLAAFPIRLVAAFDHRHVFIDPGEAGGVPLVIGTKPIYGLVQKNPIEALSEVGDIFAENRAAVTGKNEPRHRLRSDGDPGHGIECGGGSELGGMT